MIASRLKRIPTLLLVIAVTIVALLSACKADVNLAVDEEDNGSIELIVALNDSVISLLGLAGEFSIDDLLDFAPEPSDGQASEDGTSDDAMSEELDDFRIERYEQGGFTGDSGTGHVRSVLAGTASISRRLVPRRRYRHGGFGFISLHAHRG